MLAEAIGLGMSIPRKCNELQGSSGVQAATGGVGFCALGSGF